MNVDKVINKLKLLIDVDINNERYEKAINTVKTLAEVYYGYNQIYTDIELEEKLLFIRDNILSKNIYDVDKDCVFFYDGFGLDLRGLAVVYARALTSLNYHVIYACPDTMRGKIPRIISEFDMDKTEIIYINKSRRNIERIKQIDSIFTKYKPRSAFFYTTPWDVEGAMAFSNNSSTIKFQIDLTDHAYWIGINAFDYIINGREMGASIAHYERGISRNRLIKLDCSPYINRDICERPLPFDIRTTKYVFTGGALYKTLGDKGLLYYKTIDNILENFKDISFLYAGSGNDGEIKKIISKYPGRAYLIAERPDFYELIKHCILYINSYPMFGGLMMRYAALAGKIPITLKHSSDADGILFNQEKLGIEYDDYDEFINEIHRLLSDDIYRAKKEDMLINSVMTEDDFARNLNLLIEEKRTEYSFNNIEKFDTTEFRNEYKKRYTNEQLYKTIAKKSNIRLMRFFPKEFIWGVLSKMKERL